MTEILNLPLLTFPITIWNNEWWTDGWAYLDVSGAPISLAGLTLVMMVRRAADDAEICIGAASASGVLDPAIPAGSLSTGGDGLNVLAVAVPENVVGTLSAGTYVFEVKALGDGMSRLIANGVLSVNQGTVR